MRRKQREAGLHPALWTVILFAVIIGAFVLTIGAFNRDFRPYARVTLTSDRSGLVMEPGAKVKLRGVQVGRVASIQPGEPVRLQLELYPEQLKYIPANVAAEITATTAFGAKYVDLLTPTDPSPRPLRAGAVVASRNVTTEVNTVFQNLVGVLNKVDVAKLNGILTTLADGFRGRGEAIGEATTDLNQVLMAINPRSETVRADFRALKGFSETYSAAARDIVTVLDSVSTTSSTLSSNAKQLDSLLLNTGLSRSGVDLLGPNKDNLVHGINLLEPTTRLLMKYNPELTCLLVGAKNVLDFGFLDIAGGKNGYSAVLDVALLLGDDAYSFPQNLPVNDIKGGPGGKPSCGSLPDVAKNFPQRYLVTNSGWGTGMDVRPNPGIGFPGYVDYAPVTRGTPRPPSIRHPGGPAPGPVPGTDGYSSPAPYGAPRYTPDGTPLYPGLPPAPPPGRPREAGPPPAGSEPFVPTVPDGPPPTCGIVTGQCVPSLPPPYARAP
jgi:phospholipid/cholesterol/gamma-HCH transport system substrate-binding protein